MECGAPNFRVRMVCIGSAKSLNGTIPNRYSSCCRLRELLNWLNLNPFWPTASKHTNRKSQLSHWKATHFPHAISHRTLTLSDYRTCDRRSAPQRSSKWTRPSQNKPPLQPSRRKRQSWEEYAYRRHGNG